MITWLSQLFLPTIKEVPSDATMRSHSYSVRSGLVLQLAAGLYNILPLGLRVLRKIEDIIKDEMVAANAQELLMPIIQPADLWQQSGRYADYGPEMVRFEDRGGRELLLAPTHEEVATYIFQQRIKSYKELPQNWYHIQWKFRDEIRPRFGLMRAREFLMKDGYSFDIDHESALRTYDVMYSAYLRTFSRMGLRCIPVVTNDSGPIGGSLNHEFHIVAEYGENDICYDARLDSYIPTQTTEHLKEKKLYGVTADLFKEEDTRDIAVVHAKSIEVGHIFHFGKKYSEKLGASVTDAQGKVQFVHMGSYGIGVTRLIGAIIEASSDDAGIIWPLAVAPFSIGVVDLLHSEEAKVACCNALSATGLEILYDDSRDSAGVKFSRMDLIGLPWQIILGRAWNDNSQVELKNRKTGERSIMSIEACAEFCAAIH